MRVHKFVLSIHIFAVSVSLFSIFSFPILKQLYSRSQTHFINANPHPLSTSFETSYFHHSKSNSSGTGSLWYTREWTSRSVGPCSHTLSLLLSTSVSLRDLTHLQKSHTQIWSNHYKKNINHNSHYFRLEPELPPKPWFVDFNNFSRNSIVSICRLWFNYSHLPTNLTRFRPKISPYCPLHPESNTLATVSYTHLTLPTIYSV